MKPVVVCRVCQKRFGTETKRHCPNLQCSWCVRCVALNRAKYKKAQ
jgi:hypothetical protein